MVMSGSKPDITIEEKKVCLISKIYLWRVRVENNFKFICYNPS